MARSLTKRQRQILDYIGAEVLSKGYPPSVREIGAAVGLSSSSTVHSHLAALEKKGLIKRDPSKPRALLLTNRPQPQNEDSLSIPLVGQVAAGQPITAVENIENHLSWPVGIGPRPTFALRIKGDSMIDAGIFDGDVVMVRKQETADNGEIVVALIEDEATVKKFYKETNRIRLEPANAAYEPIYSSEAAVLGKVVGLMRQF